MTVKVFQTLHHLTPDGIVGKKTRAVMNEVMHTVIVHTPAVTGVCAPGEMFSTVTGSKC